MRKSRAKYEKGEPVADLISLAYYLDLFENSTKLPLFYFGSRETPLNWAFLQGMPFRVIANAIKHKRLWHAQRKREETKDAAHS